ncbi:MAG: ribulokinase [Chthonomonadales bacterium]|nr:ribulokinase [Chthonomonadales bacterium]
METSRYAIGVDFGTNSVRALIVDVETGEEVATAVHDYTRGERGVISDPDNPHVARQDPADYHEGLLGCIPAALAIAKSRPGFSPEQVIGIGVDTTGSTPIPVDAAGTPLCMDPRFAGNLNAMAWLWKDHSGMAEAERITEIASANRPQYLQRCGGTYSSEWFFSKIWHCLNVDREVFDAAHSWVEFCDYIPALLVGETNPARLKRSVCAAGHKAMYAADWGGLPDAEFLAMLDPAIGALRSRLYDHADSSDVRAGGLCDEWARKLGLPAGIAVAVGAFDAHYGGVGAGVKLGTLVKIIGTSTCDITIAPRESDAASIPGVCGVVDGSVVPGYWGIEAGQSAVGDIFNWFVTDVCEAGPELHDTLTRQASELSPGQSGLLALDWNNGNRTILVDARLTGLLVGQTLHTTRAEIYRALIEATAFGAHTILNRMREYGVPIEQTIACGGIAEKNPLLMQIYADVEGQPISVTRSSQTCALGAAIFGAVAAGAYPDTETAQAAMASSVSATYRPDAGRQAVYAELYALYKRLHDSFGIAGHSDSLGDIMKKLLDIKQRATA